MAFKFKKISVKKDVLGSRKPQVARDGEEILRGTFQGFPAARDEEFFMTEAQQHPNVTSVTFRMSLGAPRGIPGWLELDGLLDTTNGFRAFEIDDMSFIHKGQKERSEMMVKDLRRLAGLKKIGVNIRAVEHIDAKDLKDRATTRQTIRKLML